MILKFHLLNLEILMGCEAYIWAEGSFLSKRIGTYIFKKFTEVHNIAIHVRDPPKSLEDAVNMRDSDTSPSQ